MTRYKIILEYHGRAFVGWQRQAWYASFRFSMVCPSLKVSPCIPSQLLGGAVSRKRD